MEEIVNRVANSSLLTIDLEEMYPEGEQVLYDIKDNLWEGFALKEKDFRQFVKEKDWSVYKDKLVAIHCSVDAIVPTWAYMLLTTAISPFARKVIFGDLSMMPSILFEDAINAIDVEKYRDAKVVVKGCSKKAVPTSAFVKLTEKLMPVVKSMMFGEACSSVPLYKQPRNTSITKLD